MPLIAACSATILTDKSAEEYTKENESESDPSDQQSTASEEKQQESNTKENDSQFNPTDHNSTAASAEEEQRQHRLEEEQQQRLQSKQKNVKDSWKQSNSACKGWKKPQLLYQ